MTNLIKAQNVLRGSLVLYISHSMPESEDICDKIGIMTKTRFTLIDRISKMRYKWRGKLKLEMESDDDQALIQSYEEIIGLIDEDEKLEGKFVVKKFDRAVLEIKMIEEEIETNKHISELLKRVSIIMDRRVQDERVKVLVESFRLSDLYEMCFTTVI